MAMEGDGGRGEFVEKQGLRNGVVGFLEVYKGYIGGRGGELAAL